MLDIKFIRENPDLVKEAARKKHIDFDVAKLLEADDLRLKILREVEDMRARQNAASDNIAKIQNSEERQKAIAEMKELKENMERNDAPCPQHSRCFRAGRRERRAKRGNKKMGRNSGFQGERI